MVKITMLLIGQFIHPASSRNHKSILLTSRDGEVQMASHQKLIAAARSGKNTNQSGNELNLLNTILVGGLENGD